MEGACLWIWSVDYAPVAFDPGQFWMPKTITSKAEANDASAHLDVRGNLQQLPQAHRELAHHHRCRRQPATSPAVVVTPVANTAAAEENSPQAHLRSNVAASSYQLHLSCVSPARELHRATEYPIYPEAGYDGELAQRDTASSAGKPFGLPGQCSQLLCDERAVSDIQLPNRRRIFRTSTDSTFRLRRSTETAKPRSFSESREVKQVNGAPASGGTLHGPAIFTGAFSGALSVVSPEMSRCYDYKLEEPGQLGTIPVVAISYAIKRTALSDPFCPGPEKESGRAWIDPATFHLVRIEMRTPNHKMDPGTQAMWTWAVDYVPVTFDNKQFWMPKIISTKATANDIPVVWSFTATYSNYHKLIVSSHIITDVGDEPPIN
jgi:hypothetical protein